MGVEQVRAFTVTRDWPCVVTSTGTLYAEPVQCAFTSKDARFSLGKPVTKNLPRIRDRISVSYNDPTVHFSILMHEEQSILVAILKEDEQQHICIIQGVNLCGRQVPLYNLYYKYNSKL